MELNKHGPIRIRGRDDPPWLFGSRGDPPIIYGARGDPPWMFGARGDPPIINGKGRDSPEAQNSRDGPFKRFTLSLSKGGLIFRTITSRYRPEGRGMPEREMNGDLSACATPDSVWDERREEYWANAGYKCSNADRSGDAVRLEGCSNADRSGDAVRLKRYERREVNIGYLLIIYRQAFKTCKL
jgi:hypothetical protein